MSKLYNAQYRLTYEAAGCKYISSEEIKRRLAHEIIEEMSLEDLSSLFSFNVINPTTKESLLRLSDVNTPEWEKELIKMNMTEFTIQYNASLIVNE